MKSGQCLDNEIDAMATTTVYGCIKADTPQALFMEDVLLGCSEGRCTYVALA